MTAYECLLEPEIDPKAEEIARRLEQRLQASGLSKHNVSTWFRPIQGLALSADRIRFLAPNRQAVDWITTNWTSKVRAALDVEGLQHLQFEIVCREDLEGRSPPPAGASTVQPSTP